MKFSIKSLNQKAFARRLKAFSQNSVVRWWIVGLFFTFVNIPILILFVDLWQMPKWAATFLASEVVTILRFFVNDRWVFGHVFPSWVRLWQYHVANVGSSILWYSVTNALIYFFSVNYIWASIVGTGFSVGLSMITNFLWIWKPKKKKKS